jgi:hypothetical protein
MIMAGMRHGGRRCSTDDDERNHRGEEKRQGVLRLAHLQSAPSTGESYDAVTTVMRAGRVRQLPAGGVVWNKHPPRNFRFLAKLK